MNITNKSFNDDLNINGISAETSGQVVQDSKSEQIEFFEEIEEIIKDAQKLVSDNDIELISLEEEENNLPSPRDVELVTEALNKKINEAVADVDKKLDQLFKDSVNDSDEEKIKKALKIIHDNYYQNIEEKLESKESKKEIAHTATELLKLPLEAMIMGCHFAEKISDNLESAASLATVSSEAALSGLGIIGIGIQCYSIQNQAKKISINHEKIQLILEKIKNEKNVTVTNELHKEILILEKEIEHLSKEVQTKIISVTQEFFVEAFEQTSNFIDFTASSTHLFVSHANILTKLMEVSTGLSIAGAIVSLGWTSYQVYEHSHQLKTIDKRIAELSKKHEAMDSDEVYLAYIVQSKLDRMKEQKSNVKLKLGLRILNLSASSLALTAAVKGALIASGVAVGATASIALTGTGVVGLTLLGGTAAAGTGVVVYQNRYNIEHALKTIPLITQKLILKKQLKKSEKVYEQATETIKNLINAFDENKVQKLSLLIIPDNIEDLLKLKNPQTRFIDIMDREEGIIEQLNNTNKVLSDASESIKELFKKIDVLNTKRKDVSLEKKLKNLEKGFKNYDLTTLNIVKKVIEEGLADSSNQIQIRDFLRKELSKVGIEATWDDVLNYIVSGK